MNSHKLILEGIYQKYNKRDLVSPDPLQFLYDYDHIEDREIVGIIASSLAYGRVQQILKSITVILEIVGDSPVDFLRSCSLNDFRKYFEGFKHRFTTAEDMALLFDAMKSVTVEFSSLEEAFMTGYSNDDDTLLPAMSLFIERLTTGYEGGKSYLLPAPERGSACKRFNLFLRWMVRSDDVDPGGWNQLPASKLFVPLDTHMNNICTSVGITKRKNADMKAVKEITEWFRNINIDDPVKYDFALTRFGIRDDMSIEDLLGSLMV